MFFLRRTRPLELTARRLRALRVSLNTPVVSMQDLPAGPARAAIALHDEPRGGRSVTVGVRALGSGSVVLYGFEGAVGEDLADDALDAALSFAEGMGFLFDDETVGGDAASQEKALARWVEAIGDASLPASAPEPEALELFEVAGGDLTDPPAPATPEPSPGWELARPAPEPAGGAGAGEIAFQPAPEEGPAGPALTKFRLRADTPPAETAPGDAEAPRAASKRVLARVRLAKRAPQPLVQDARRSWLLRLLTSF